MNVKMITYVMRMQHVGTLMEAIAVPVMKAQLEMVSHVKVSIAKSDDEPNLIILSPTRSISLMR